MSAIDAHKRYASDRENDDREGPYEDGEDMTEVSHHVVTGSRIWIDASTKIRVAGPDGDKTIELRSYGPEWPWIDQTGQVWERFSAGPTWEHKRSS